MDSAICWLERLLESFSARAELELAAREFAVITSLLEEEEQRRRLNVEVEGAIAKKRKTAKIAEEPLEAKLPSQLLPEIQQNTNVAASKIKKSLSFAMNVQRESLLLSSISPIKSTMRDQTIDDISPMSKTKAEEFFSDIEVSHMPISDTNQPQASSIEPKLEDQSIPMPKYHNPILPASSSSASSLVTSSELQAMIESMRTDPIDANSSSVKQPTANNPLHFHPNQVHTKDIPKVVISKIPKLVSQLQPPSSLHMASASSSQNTSTLSSIPKPVLPKIPAQAEKAFKILLPSVNSTATIASTSTSSNSSSQSLLKSTLAKSAISTISSASLASSKQPYECPRASDVVPHIDTDSEDDADESKRKTNIPRWAHTPALKRALSVQIEMSPAEIFGPVPSLKLEEMMNGSKNIPPPSPYNWK